MVNNDASGQIHQTVLHSYPWNLIADNGDVISYPNENLEHETIATVKNDYLDENIPSSMKSQSESINIDNEIIETHATLEESIPITEQQHFNFEHTEHPLTHVDSQHTILIEQEIAMMTNTSKHDDHSRSSEVQTIGENKKRQILV